MPVLPEVKGLLPGRGPAGRGPGVGRGPGAGADGRLGAAGASLCWAGAGAENSAAGAAGRGAGAGVCSAGAAAGRGAGAGRGPGVGRGPGAGAAGRAAPPGVAGRAVGAAGLRGAGLGEDPAPPLAEPFPLLNAFSSFRTTGASMVEDAERTNSPSSWSLAITTLLSTPNSLASSSTRTLATSLLLGPGWSSAGPSLLHGRTHRVLIECSSQSRPAFDSRGTWCSARACG